MKFHHSLIMGGLLSAYLFPSEAATLIEQQDNKGTQKVFLADQQVRLESGEPSRYRLIDLPSKKAYTIDTKEQRIVEMEVAGTPPALPSNMPSLPKASPVEAELVKKGEGPKIAGYATVNYEVTANGKVCSENYFSKEAAKIAHLNEFMEAMYTLSSSRKPKGMPMPPCQQAHDNLEKESMALGVPMKSVIKWGDKEKVRHEVKRIQTDVTVAKDFFDLPKGFKRITEEEMIKENTEKMQDWMKEHPPRQRGQSPFGDMPR